MVDAPAAPVPRDASRDTAGRLRGRLLGACLGTLLTITATGCDEDPARVSEPAAEAPGPGSADDPVPSPGRASVVLRDWDRARAAAYAHGDVAALRRLYLGRSEAGRADARLLRRYLARGLRVEGMRTQLLELRVLAHGSHRMRLRVVERLVGAEAVHRRTGFRQPLPHAAAGERVVELRRTPDGAWRVVGVSG
jgi:hypothetical protein